MFQSYIEATRETAVYPGAGTGNAEELMYLALGLGGEVCEELITEVHNMKNLSNMFKELGDCSYYLFRLSDALDIEIQMKKDFVMPIESILVQKLSSNSGIVMNIIKKVQRDGLNLKKTNMESTQRYKLRKALQELLDLLSGMCGFYGRDYLEVLSENTEKLLDRKRRGVLQGSGDTR